MRKYFYILITLLAVLSIGFVACKNKPTAVSDFGLDDLKEDTSSQTPKPTSDIKVVNSGSGYNFKDYNGNIFKSKDYYKSGSSGEKFAYTLEIKTEGNSTYAILSYGDEVKAKLTGGANQTTDNKGKKFILSPSKNVIRFKYKFKSGSKNDYEENPQYAIFEQGIVVIEFSCQNPKSN